MNRPLSPLEHVVWLIDRGIQQNFVMVARVSGGITEPILKQTLDMIQLKYPPLRSKIKEGPAPEFVMGDVPPIPLRIIERKDDNQWIKIVEDEMIDPLPWTIGPLVRVTQLVSPGKFDLLVTFCHVVADATSGVLFVQNLLDFAEKLSRGQSVDPGPSLPPLPAPDNLLKDDLKFEPQPAVDSLAAGTFGPVELAGDLDVPPDKRITRVIQEILSPEETKKLVARCKEEHTSVHGALCAAFMQEIIRRIRYAREVPAEGPLVIGCVTPVDMRRHFSVPVAEYIGDFISQAIHYQPIDDKSSLWDAARVVKDSLQREINSGNDVKDICNIGELLKTFSSSIALARALNRSSAPVVATNLGRLTIPDQFGHLGLEELHFTVGVNADGKNGFGISVTTFRGNLTINFLYAEPYILKERAKTVVENTMERIKKAIL